MNDRSDDSRETVSIEPGDTVYDDEGNVVGIVDDLTDEGFDVEVIDAGRDVDVAERSESGTDHGDEAEDIPGKDFGEGYLMWRCEDCGEMGELEDGFPEECPNCGAPSEHIHMAQED